MATSSFAFVVFALAAFHAASAQNAGSAQNAASSAQNPGSAQNWASLLQPLMAALQGSQNSPSASASGSPRALISPAASISMPMPQSMQNAVSMPSAGMPSGMSMGMPNPMSNALPMGMPYGMSMGMPNPMSNALPMGMPYGMPNVMPNGMQMGMAIMPNMMNRFSSQGCMDNFVNCTALAMQGDCLMDPNVRMNCPVACGICKCEDVASNCQARMCHLIQDYTLQCAETCLACQHDCLDIDPKCQDFPTWCNTRYGSWHCRKTCNRCPR